MLYVGQGIDVHAFESPTKPSQGTSSKPFCDRLVLGGIKIKEGRPLVGHSDADVCLHALMDALLGAAHIPGASDIGELFPDSDMRFAGISSLILLEQVLNLLKKNRCTIQNVDVTLVCEEPKISPYKEAMQKNMAHALALPLERVSIKATTTEHLGFLGREEGIAAFAICLLDKKESHEDL